MKNTMCLGVFLVIVYSRQLVWDFSAEVVVIFFATLIIGCMWQRPEPRSRFGWPTLGWPCTRFPSSWWSSWTTFVVGTSINVKFTTGYFSRQTPCPDSELLSKWCWISFSLWLEPGDLVALDLLNRNNTWQRGMCRLIGIKHWTRVAFWKTGLL